MAITQAMLDAERARLGIGESAVVKSEQRAGWDACFAFLREHGVHHEVHGEVVVRVEIPAE